MTLVDRIRAMGEAMDEHSGWPPGQMAMLVGLYAGLVLGTMAADTGAAVRREIEVEMSRHLGIAPEALEADFRQQLAALQGHGLG